MSKGYRAFLLATATDLPCRGFKVTRKSEAQELFEGIQRWSKVISNLPH